jgi:SAM-dependent methyltransferase
MLIKLINLIILISRGNSLLRSLQIIECKSLKLSGISIEFGASKNNKINFNIHFNGKSNFWLSNIYNLKIKNYIQIDLTKKFKIKKNYFSNVLIFNVLEHLEDNSVFFYNLKKSIKTNGYIIGSTPFLYQVHKAPFDYYRFSKDFFYKIKKDYNYKKIIVKSLGYGPFTASYSLMFGLIRFLPILREILLILSLMLDSFLQIFVKTNLKEIYPIGYFFILKK